MVTTTETRAPFDEAEHYREAGWSGTLALPARSKKPPPEGFTGEAGKWPVPADLTRWRAEGLANLAVRLPHGVIGLDVDCYGDKPGKETLLALVAKLGEPPRTWTSTSRFDGSGIRWFRVPADVRDWPGEAGPGIEIIRYAHRFAVVPPSIHPEGRRYVWTKSDRTRAAPGEIPRPGDLAELPAAWVRYLTGVDTETGERTTRPGSRAEQRERRKGLATGSPNFHQAPRAHTSRRSLPTCAPLHSASSGMRTTIHGMPCSRCSTRVSGAIMACPA